MDRFDVQIHSKCGGSALVCRHMFRHITVRVQRDDITLYGYFNEGGRVHQFCNIRDEFSYVKIVTALCAYHLHRQTYPPTIRLIFPKKHTKATNISFIQYVVLHTWDLAPRVPSPSTHYKVA